MRPRNGMLLAYTLLILLMHAASTLDQGLKRAAVNNRKLLPLFNSLHTQNSSIASDKYKVFKFDDKLIVRSSEGECIHLFLDQEKKLRIEKQLSDYNVLRSVQYTADIIYGIYEFSYGSYLAIVTSSECAFPFLNPHARKINEISLVPIPSAIQYSRDSNELSSKVKKNQLDVEKLLSNTFSKHSFYFSSSSSYDITRSRQHNSLLMKKYNDIIGPIIEPWIMADQKFFWNFNLNERLLQNNLSHWITPVVNAWTGAKNCTVNGRNITLSIISRRSRKRQGPRYLKRGSDEEGEVANYVLTEQLLRLRGSIPLFWQQPDIWKLKPSIVISPENLTSQINSLRHHLLDIYSTFIAPFQSTEGLHSAQQCAGETFVPSSPARDSLISESKRKIIFLNLIDKQGSQGSLGRLLTLCFSKLSDTSSSISNVDSAYLNPFRLVSLSKIMSKLVNAIFGSSAPYLTPIDQWLSPRQAAETFNSSSVTLEHVKHTLSHIECSAIVNHSVWTKLLSHEEDLVDINIKYLWFDYHHKVSTLKTVKALKEILSNLECFDETTNSRSKANLGLDYFLEDDNNASYAKFIQKTIIRTNCIDCLDRTNVVQTAIARMMIIRQLEGLGIWNRTSIDKYSTVLPYEDLESALRHLWSENGDNLSLLYAGTRALKRDVTKIGKRTRSGAWNDGINSVLRYYLNNRVDGYRQKGVDIVLGLSNSSSLKLYNKFAVPIIKRLQVDHSRSQNGHSNLFSKLSSSFMSRKEPRMNEGKSEALKSTDESTKVESVKSQLPFTSLETGSNEKPKSPLMNINPSSDAIALSTEMLSSSPESYISSEAIPASGSVFENANVVTAIDRVISEIERIVD